MNPTQRPNASVRTELKVALGLSAVWLVVALMLFALLPGRETSPQSFAANDMWGARLPDLNNPVLLDADIPGAPHEHHEDDQDDFSYARYLPHYAKGPQTSPQPLLTSRVSGAAAAHASGRPAFSSDGTFLGTVCCVDKQRADRFGLLLTKGNHRYSLTIPASRVGVRGTAIEIGMTWQDINQAAGNAAPRY